MAQKSRAAQCREAHGRQAPCRRAQSRRAQSRRAQSRRASPGAQSRRASRDLVPGRPGRRGWTQRRTRGRRHPAQREASRRQGRALLRAARAAWPGPWLADLAAAPQPPHHAVVLGATAAAAGCSPGEAALIAAYLTVTGRASAAVRLLALDPIEVSATIARLADAIETAAARGAAAETDDLPCPSAPALDLYAEAHARAEVRLFAS